MVHQAAVAHRVKNSWRVNNQQQEHYCKQGTPVPRPTGRPVPVLYCTPDARDDKTNKLPFHFIFIFIIPVTVN